MTNAAKSQCMGKIEGRGIYTVLVFGTYGIHPGLYAIHSLPTGAPESTARQHQSQAIRPSAARAWKGCEGLNFLKINGNFTFTILKSQS